MKKLLGLLSLLIYLVSTNALIHAQSMNILPHHSNISTSSCHGYHSNQNSTSQDQNADCCELVTSNQYFHTQIQAQTIQYSYPIFPVKDTISLIFPSKIVYAIQDN